jgi:hypothetical protein
VAIQFAYDGAAPRLDTFHLHAPCYALWELERTTGRPDRA